MSDLSRFIDVEAAKAEFGDTEYEYVSIYVQFSYGRKRGTGNHICREPVTCTKEEFDAHHESGQKKETDRFFRAGRPRDAFKESFTRYERRIKTPGWRERLIELLKTEIE